MQPPLITALLQPTAYDHPVKHTKLLETHISWVILTGQYAYKIKKPVDFGFINYSTLEKRHYYCEQEILLNSPLAAQLYIQVVPITQNAAGYQLNGDGTVVEYAVKMLEFSQTQMLNHLLPQQGLTQPILYAIAKQLANFHAQASRSDNNTCLGTPEIAQQYTAQNFSQAYTLLNQFSLATPEYLVPLQTLENYAQQEFTRIATTLLTRKNSGFVRSCHADLRLANIALLDNQPIIFDCVEFNDELRWTDVMGDVGFLTMDLCHHKHLDYAMAFLNTYLTYTGDYAGLAVLPYFVAYRAMVRAKIQLFSIQPSDDATTRQTYFAKYTHYVQLATDYLTQRQPYLVIMHGFSGSGKSTLANSLAEQLGAIVIRSDVERKRLFKLTPDDYSQSAVNAQLYQPEVTQRTYNQLHLLASEISQAGYPVIIDATCLQTRQRKLFLDLAAKQQLSLVIVDCVASPQSLSTRLEHAEPATRYFSEADKLVLQNQLQNHEPLTASELTRTLTVHTDKSLVLSEVLTQLHALLGITRYNT